MLAGKNILQSCSYLHSLLCNIQNVLLYNLYIAYIPFDQILDSKGSETEL